MKKKMTTYVLTALMLLSCVALVAPAKVEAISPPSKPTLAVTTYNAMVVYRWDIGTGGTELALSRSLSYYGNTGQTSYTDIAIPFEKKSKLCNPQYYYGYSYNSNTELYSNLVSTEKFYTDQEGDLISTGIYGENCLYTCENMLLKALCSPEDTVPKKYDQDRFIWYHNGNTSNIIKGTIAYQGVVKDFNLFIPPLFYQTEKVTINGITFEFRSGPNRCSFRTKASGVMVYDVLFAFGLA